MTMHYVNLCDVVETSLIRKRPEERRAFPNFEINVLQSGMITLRCAITRCLLDNRNVRRSLNLNIREREECDIDVQCYKFLTGESYEILSHIKFRSQERMYRGAT